MPGSGAAKGRRRHGGQGDYARPLGGQGAPAPAPALNDLLPAIVDAACDAVFITDREGKILFANRAFGKITGYAAAEALGKNPRLIASGAHTRSFYRDMWETILAGRPWKGEFVNRRKNGARYVQRTSISPVAVGGGDVSHFLAVASDVSNEKQIEEQFFQALKMDSLGRLAGGIAHDFNNLLTIINGYAEMVLADSAGLRVRENVQSIYNAGEKAARLISHILAFGRKQIIYPRVLNVNGVVREQQQMIRGILGENIALQIDLAADVAPLRIDVSQLEQVLMNLVVNSRDAMTSGGRLLISSANFTMDDDFVARHLGSRKGEYVRLEVVDTGRGMAPEVQQHVFEPFFTTKRLGEGTGLGLASVYGIVKQNGGYITFGSEPGKGTRFSIYFPRHESPELGEAATGGEGKGPPFAGRTVLLIEADDTVRKLDEKVLQAAGFQVLEAVNWDLALRLSRGSGHSIDLLLADVMAPDMPGSQAAEKLLAAQPGARILLTSGYSEKHAGLAGGAGRIVGFIAKPFNRQELLEKVGEILDRKD
jgi:two-component system cell cycle sensor histidine kinase/response regulator CckA